MIHLLFTVLAVEAGLATALLFKTPLRKLAMLALDRLKRGRAPVMVRTVAGTVLVVLASSLHSMTKIHSHAGGGELDAPGALSPTDQVLLARHLLEASLMGYSLFLALVIDRLHNYIREMRGLKKNLEAVSKQNKTFEEAKFGSSDDDDSKAHQKDIASLNEKIKKLKLQLKEKKEEVKDAEAKAVAAKTQSEGLMLKYDRLLEDNKHLLDQVQSGDIAVSRPEGKKNT